MDLHQVDQSEIALLTAYPRTRPKSPARPMTSGTWLTLQFLQQFLCARFLPTMRSDLPRGASRCQAMTAREAATRRFEKRWRRGRMPKPSWARLRRGIALLDAFAEGRADIPPDHLDLIVKWIWPTFSTTPRPMLCSPSHSLKPVQSVRCRN